jgi:hypothetical protein
MSVPVCFQPRRLSAVLLTGALCMSLITAAIADGPGGLGKLQPPIAGSVMIDGSVLYSNGTVLYPDGHVVWSDANQTVWYPSVLSDGSYLYVDGTRLYPDGSITYAQ